MKTVFLGLSSTLSLDQNYILECSIFSYIALAARRFLLNYMSRKNRNSFCPAIFI